MTVTTTYVHSDRGPLLYIGDANTKVNHPSNWFHWNIDDSLQDLRVWNLWNQTNIPGNRNRIYFLV